MPIAPREAPWASPSEWKTSSTAFAPVAQGKSRTEGKTEFTKHMIRMRFAGTDGYAKPEANESIIVNSHEGASSYQLLCGRLRLCPAVHRRNYVPRRTMSSNRQPGL